MFSIDPSTGRLSLVTNQQIKNSAGTNLTYFPVGSGPINFALYNSSFLYTIEKGSGSASDPSQAVFVYAFANGQLTSTQNTPIPSNALGHLTYIYASSKYVYLLDSGNASFPEGLILPYTSGTNGALQSVTGGPVANTGTTANPSEMLVEHSGNFLYVANYGPESDANQSSEQCERVFHYAQHRNTATFVVGRRGRQQHTVRQWIRSNLHSGRSIEPIPLHCQLQQQRYSGCAHQSSRGNID